jgi:hypothetical protein
LQDAIFAGEVGPQSRKSTVRSVSTGFSHFLSADKRNPYCLYEAENPEAIREAARRLNIPADAIIEFGEVPADSPVTKWSVLR